MLEIQRTNWMTSKRKELGRRAYRLLQCSLPSDDNSYSFRSPCRWESGMPWRDPDLRLEGESQLRYEQQDSLCLVRKCERRTITFLVSIHQSLPIEFTHHFIPRMTPIKTLPREDVTIHIAERESLSSLPPIPRTNPRTQHSASPPLQN